MSDELVVVPSDLAELPYLFREVQIGLPLYAHTPLAPRQRDAVQAFFDLVEPHWRVPEEREQLTANKWLAMRSAYQQALAVGLGDYCIIIRLGAAFALDEAALARAVTAEQSVTVCFGCH